MQEVSDRGGQGKGRWEWDSHVWTEFVEVPVAILLHLVRRVDGQGPVGVHRDHHAADVRLQRREQSG